MPPAIAAAVVKVMSGVRVLGKDDKNQFAKYDFASIDKFLTLVNPLCAAAGLFFVLNEEGYEIRKGEATEGGKVVSALCMTYSILMVEAGGATWGPVTRHVIVTAAGAQAFGTAQSYVLKQFMRSLFQIPTGDKDDADLQEARELPSGAGRSAPRQQAAPAPSGQQKAAGGDTELMAKQANAKADFARIKSDLKACQTEVEIDTVMIAGQEALENIKAVSPQGYLNLMKFCQDTVDGIRQAGLEIMP